MYFRGKETILLTWDRRTITEGLWPLSQALSALGQTTTNR
jgi:hypothetical protein